MNAINSDINPDTPRARGDYSAPHMTPVTPAEDLRTIMLNRASVGAVFCGVTAALAIQVVLNLVGVGIGLVAVDQTVTTADVPEFSVNAALWWTVSGIIAAFIGGFTAGRMAGEPRESSAGWHGFVSWATSILIITLVMATAAGAVLSGDFRNLTGVNASNSNSVSIGGMTLDNDTSRALSGVLASDATDLESARLEAAERMSQTQGIALEDARSRVLRYEQDQRTFITNRADVLTAGALTAAAALVLGAIASIVGGRMGAVKPTVTDTRLRRTQLH